MWEQGDKNIAHELIGYAATALKRNPPDYNAATVGFGSASEFELFNGSAVEAERLAREAVKTASTEPGDLGDKAGTLYLLVQLTGKRGAFVEAE